MCILFAFAFVLGALANSTRFLVNLFLKLSQWSIGSLFIFWKIKANEQLLYVLN